MWGSPILIHDCEPEQNVYRAQHIWENMLFTQGILAKSGQVSAIEQMKEDSVRGS